MFSLYKKFKGLFYSVLFWLCILSFFSVLNEMVLNVSLPDIANHFNTTPGITLQIILILLLELQMGKHCIYVNFFDRNSSIWKII